MGCAVAAHHVAGQPGVGHPPPGGVPNAHHPAAHPHHHPQQPQHQQTQFIHQINQPHPNLIFFQQPVSLPKASFRTLPLSQGFISCRFDPDSVYVVPVEIVDSINQCKSCQPSCQASDCHCRKMFHRLDQIWWQSEDRQTWPPMACGSCTDWYNLRYTGRINDIHRYL